MIASRQLPKCSSFRLALSFTGMNADANREGFRILRRDPALLPIELLWRWSFGLGLLALFFLIYARFRQAVLLSAADQIALTSQDPFAAAVAASNLIAGALPLLLGTLARISGLAAVFWIASATLGRGIITRLIVRRFAASADVAIAPDAPRWASFAMLNFARVLMLLILVIGYLGGSLIAALVSGPGQDVVFPSLIVFIALVIAVAVWSYINWVLSLAPVLVVRDGLAPLDSVVAAIAFIRRNRSKLMALAIWNGTLRGVAASIISVAGAFTLALYGTPQPWIATALLVVETLVYLVVSDIFLLVRLAAYASVAVRELALSQGFRNLRDFAGRSHANCFTANPHSANLECGTHGASFHRCPRFRLAIHPTYCAAYSRTERLLGCPALYG